MPVRDSCPAAPTRHEWVQCTTPFQAPPMLQLTLSPVVVLPIAALSTAGVLARPFRIAEAWWAMLGAALLLLTGQVNLAEFGRAVGQGTDVYLFLIGMMLVAEMARTTGLFDWIAAQAVRRSNG